MTSISAALTPEHRKFITDPNGNECGFNRNIAYFRETSGIIPRIFEESLKILSFERALGVAGIGVGGLIAGSIVAETCFTVPCSTILTGPGTALVTTAVTKTGVFLIIGLPTVGLVAGVVILVAIPAIRSTIRGIRNSADYAAWRKERVIKLFLQSDPILEQFLCKRTGGVPSYPVIAPDNNTYDFVAKPSPIYECYFDFLSASVIIARLDYIINATATDPVFNNVRIKCRELKQKLEEHHRTETDKINKDFSYSRRNESDVAKLLREGESLKKYINIERFQKYRWDGEPKEAPPLISPKLFAERREWIDRFREIRTGVLPRRRSSSPIENAVSRFFSALAKQGDYLTFDPRSAMIDIKRNALSNACDLSSSGYPFLQAISCVSNRILYNRLLKDSSNAWDLMKMRYGQFEILQKLESHLSKEFRILHERDKQYSKRSFLNLLNPAAHVCSRLSRIASGRFLQFKEATKDLKEEIDLKHVRS